MSERMLALMLKSKTDQPLTAEEQQQLDEWLNRSTLNGAVDKLGSPQPGRSSSMAKNDSVSDEHCIEDDGSANAFEGTENSKEYEQDLSDEKLDNELI